MYFHCVRCLLVNYGSYCQSWREFVYCFLSHSHYSRTVIINEFFVHVSTWNCVKRCVLEVIYSFCTRQQIVYFACGSSCKVLWWVRLCVCVYPSVCLSTRISPEPHVRSLPNLLCMLPMAVAPYFSGVVAICYVFPVVWMTSCFSSTLGHIAVWILLWRINFAQIYLFTATSDNIQFPFIKEHNFVLTIVKLLANRSKRGTEKFYN